MTQISSTVDNAMGILRLVGESGSATAIELAKKTGLSRTIVYRALITLEKHGLVRSSGSKYSLGYSILQLADHVDNDIRSAARPGLEELATAYHTTSILFAREGTECVIIDQCVSQSTPTQIRYSLGFRSSLSSGGHGRAILAFSPPDVIEQVKDAVADPDAVASLEAALVEIREKGYALSSNEIRPGVTGLAVPTVDRDGYAIGSIGLVTLAGHFPDVDEVAQSLMGVAADVSKHRLSHG